MEIAVVLDASGSMQNHNKMEQAKLAAKFVAGGFLSNEQNYDASNVRVAIYSFNTTKHTVFPATWGPSLQNIYNSIVTFPPAVKQLYLTPLKTRLNLQIHQA